MQLHLVIMHHCCTSTKFWRCDATEKDTWMSPDVLPSSERRPIVASRWAKEEEMSVINQCALAPPRRTDACLQQVCCGQTSRRKGKRKGGAFHYLLQLILHHPLRSSGSFLPSRHQRSLNIWMPLL